MIELLFKILIFKCVFYVCFHSVSFHYIFKLGHPPYVEDIKERGLFVAFIILTKTIVRIPPPFFRGYRDAFQILSLVKKV